ncbi:MAG: hypothetical protein ABIP89_00710 [Polyangiaceae bacterium]
MHWLTTAFDGFVGFFPSLIAGLAILLLGYVLAVVLRRVTHALAARLGINRIFLRLGLEDSTDPDAGARWMGLAVFWIVILAAGMQAARAWQLEFIAVGLARVLQYVPHVIAAAVIIVAAMLFGNWVRGRIARPGAVTVNGELASSDPASQRTMVASAVRAGILALGSFMALRELQIAPEIVTIAFTLTLAAIALATALAFGLGSREVAGRVAQRWYEHRGVRSDGESRIPSARP